jgi:hypothetical protein
MKKDGMILFCMVLLLGMTVGNAFGGSKKEAGNTVYFFGPTPDHGWTGSAARFAEEKIAELNKAGGKYAIGAGAAYYRAEKGLTPGETIGKLPGDNSAVSMERGSGTG